MRLTVYEAVKFQWLNNYRDRFIFNSINHCDNKEKGLGLGLSDGINYSGKLSIYIFSITLIFVMEIVFPFSTETTEREFFSFSLKQRSKLFGIKCLHIYNIKLKCPEENEARH